MLRLSSSLAIPQAAEARNLHITLNWFWYFHAPSESATHAEPFLSRHPLDLDSRLESLLALLNTLLGLEAHDATTPLLASSLVLLKITVLDGGNELSKLVLVLGADLGDGKNGGSLYRFY